MHFDASAAAAVSAVAAQRGVQRSLAVAIFDLRVGVVRDEHFHDIVPAPQCRAEQRCLSLGVARIHVGAGFHQQLDALDGLGRRFELAARIDFVRGESRRGHQRRDAGDVRQMRIGSMRQQQLNGRRIARLRGTQQGSGVDGEHQVRAAIRAERAERRKQFQPRIRVRALGQQHLDELQAGGLVERGTVGTAAERNGVHVYRGVQRSAAPPVPLVGVGALLDQVSGNIEVEIVDGDDQRRDALGIGHVHVGAGFDQRLHAFLAAAPSRIKQRRESAARSRLRARFGGDLSLRAFDFRARVHVRAVLHEQLHHFRLILRRRPHQRGLAAPLLRRIHVGATLQEDLGRCDIAGASQHHQRRLAVRVG
jgi:hypothetical protein